MGLFLLLKTIFHSAEKRFCSACVFAEFFHFFDLVQGRVFCRGPVFYKKCRTGVCNRLSSRRRFSSKNKYAPKTNRPAKTIKTKFGFNLLKKFAILSHPEIIHLTSIDARNLLSLGIVDVNRITPPNTDRARRIPLQSVLGSVACKHSA